MKRGTRGVLISPADRVGGFTLVELLVAVALVGLLTVGIAQVFSLTGTTVASGRRLSTLNTAASAIERQLRTDLSAATRDGFLLIRHELIRDPIAATRGVQLWAGDERPRDRRADELVFFARGEYQSAREPLHAARVARANAARIYYGHGLRGTDAAATSPEINDPQPAALPRALGDRPAAPGEPAYANQYAGGWTLLRHVCLLAPPHAGDQTVNPTAVIPTGNPINAATWNDSDAQVALQPAVMSLFRALAAGTTPPSSNALVRGNRRPLLASGLVDIATSDLSEVRAYVNGVPLASPVNPPDAILPREPVGHPSAEPAFVPVPLANQPGPGGQLAREAMQAWMREALPAWSDDLRRMRYEPGPPNFAGAGLSWESPADPERPYRQADQLMLSASNFVPGCSEFIVEWSFAQVEPDAGVVPAALGRVLWHGLERDISVSGQAAFSNAVDYRVHPYGEGPGGPRPRGPTGPDDRAAITYQLNTGGVSERRIAPKLIHGDSLPSNLRVGPLYSYFGYTDPIFDPAPNSGGTVDAARSDFLVDVGPLDPATGRPTYDPLDGDRLIEPGAVEWPWPRLLRITMKLVDPSDPGVEQTFQFVLPLPEPGAGVQ